MSKLKIISFNAQGLKSPNKRMKVLNWASKKKFDLMAIQESHFIETDTGSWSNTWPGKILSSEGKNNSRGVTFLISPDLEQQIEGTYKDKEGRWIILDITMKKIRYTIANYYGPKES